MTPTQWLATHGLAADVRTPPPVMRRPVVDDSTPRVDQLRAAIRSDSAGLSAAELCERTGIPTNRISGLLKADMQHGRIRCDICADGRGIYSVGVQLDPREREAAEFLRRRGYVVTRAA